MSSVVDFIQLRLSNVDWPKVITNVHKILFYVHWLSHYCPTILFYVPWLSHYFTTDETHGFHS